MKTVAWALAAFALSASLPGALATPTYDAGSLVEADAPALLAGRTDALVSQSVASLIASDERTSLLLSLNARELNLTYREASPSCVPGAPLSADPCAATRGLAGEEATLESATVTLVRALSAYKVVVTNDAQYGRTSSFGAAGTIVATSAADTILSATSKPLHLSPHAPDWSDDAERVPDGPVYQVDAHTAAVTTTGGSLRGLGGLQVLLQGLEVRVSGTTHDGERYERTFSTSPSGGTVRYLVLETTGGDLASASTAPLSAYGVKTVDARGRASLQNVDGRIIDGDTTTEYRDEDVTLDGPLSLTVASVKPGSPVRLAYAVSSRLRVSEIVPPDADRDDPSQLVAAGVAGAGAAALLAGLLYLWPRLKFVGTLALLPLYTRIERTAVLDHEKRDEIYELIRASPGIHAHEIGERARIGWGTTVYHLKMLESHSLVVSKRSGRYKRFFVNTGEYTKKKDLYGALRNETAKSVAQFIVDHPGCSQKELCQALGIQPSLASWHVEKLEGVELVKRVKDGRQVRYFAGPAWELLNVRIDPTGGAATPAET